MNKRDFCCLFVFLLTAVLISASCERGGLVEDDGVVHVASIGLGLSPVEDVAVTDSLFFKVQIMPENAADRSFTWINTDPETVFIDTVNMVIKPLKPGDVIVGVVSHDGGKRGLSTIRVNEGFIHVKSIELNIPENYGIAVGGTKQLEVNIIPNKADNKKFSWINTDPSVVSIDENGLLTALEVGTATIGVKTEDREKTYLTVVSVLPPAMTSLSFPEQSYAFDDLLAPAYRIVPKIEPVDEYERELEWTTSDISCCLVDDTGLVTVTGGGTAVVTATSKDGSALSASCTITVPGTAVKDRNYDMTGAGFDDGYYKKIYEPLVIEVPVLTGVLKSDGTKETAGTIKQIWLDRNLGASARATSLWDADAAGSLFQMGRKADGHEKVSWSLSGTKLVPEYKNPVTDVQGTSRDNAGHSNFVTAPDLLDWTSDQSITGWGGPQIAFSDANYVKYFDIYSSHGDLDSDSQACNPCPYGYRIPTVVEYMQMTMAVTGLPNVVFSGENIHEDNMLVKMNEKMYMVAIGYRAGKNGVLGNAGTKDNVSTGGAMYWTNASNAGSTVTKAWQWKCYFLKGESSCKVVSIEKSAACPLRCIKED